MKQTGHTCDLILLAFITGNISLQPLLEGVFAHIHTDLSWWGFGRNRTGDLRITQICSVPRSSPLSYGDECITEDASDIERERCIYIQIRIHTYIYIYTYKYTYTYIYIHTYLHIHVYTYIHTYVHTCVHTFIYIYIYAYTRVYT